MLLIALLVTLAASVTDQASVEAASEPSVHASPAAFVYVLTPGPQLRQMHVRVEVDGATGPHTLRAPRGRLRDVSVLQACPDSPASVSPARLDGKIVLPRGLTCAEFRVQLTAVKPRGNARNLLGTGVKTFSPSAFLWLPHGLKTWPLVRVRIESRGKVSAPWPMRGEDFIVPASPGSGRSVALFGDFASVSLPGITQDAALLVDPTHADKLRSWLSASVQAVARTAGAFPNPDVQIIVFPAVARSGSPVPFGHVVRDQGETVIFYVDPSRSAADLAYDWTAAHEFSHLMLPFINSAQKWVSEGFASYYQNVLQARSGHYADAEAWRRLRRSLRKAAGESRGMSPNDTSEVDFWAARMMIYWSGAALALKADVALRSRADAPGSLDQLLARLRVCCLPSPKVWRGRELFARLDALGGNGVLTGLYDAWAERPGMPPTDALFQELGITASGPLDANAPLAHIRDAIMSPSGLSGQAASSGDNSSRNSRFRNLPDAFLGKGPSINQM